MSSGSLDILPEPTPPRRTRKPKADEAETESPAAGAGTPVVASTPATEAPAAEAAQTTSAAPAASRRRAIPSTTPAPPATPDAVPQHTETPAVYPASPAQPATPAVAAPAVAAPEAEAATPAEAAATPTVAPAAPPVEAAPATPPTPTAEGTATGAREDHAAGVRALQEAFALDVAEREDRHRAEVRAMQQSFMADVSAREDRHRAEVQALHQRSAADLATREERHRNEMHALQLELDAARAQLAETTSARDAQSEARATVEADLEQHKEDLKGQRAENARLNTQNDDLATSLASAQQQATRWNEQAQRLEKELSTARADAEKAAATAAKEYADKSKQHDDTSRELADTTRRLEAAAAQLRTTVAEQRAERERLTADRDEARQHAQELENQLRTAEFEAEQAAEEATRLHTDTLRRLEDAEEKAARVAGQAAVHEATVGELRTATSESDAELKKVTAARDSAQRRVAELEAEVSRLHRAVQIAREAVAAGLADEPDLTDATAPAVEEAAAPEAPRAIAMSDDRPLSLAEEIELAAWQREALTAWSAKGRRGVIEAISGADITPVAYWAIADALDAEMNVLVITENVEAWFNGLRAALPINRVGKVTVGRDERHAAYDVVVASVGDAARESVFGPSANVLVVADQVHDYGTRGHSPALDPEYSWRLGLTDLYERDDNGISTYLDPYFGGVSFSLGYDRALADEVIAPYDIAVVSVRMNNAEQAEYDALGKQIKDLAATLVGEFGVPPTDKFGESVAALASGRLGPARNASRAYQKAVAKRAEVVANASGKSSVLRSLAAKIKAGQPALVFAQSSAAAAHVTKVFGGEGCATRTLSGGVDRGFRRRADSLDEVVLLAGSREVVDSGRLPSVDLGVVIGASGSNRQVMERLGQIVRPGSDGGHGRLITVYVAGTDEDDLSDSSTSPIDAHASIVSQLDAAEAGALADFLYSEDAPDGASSE